MALLDIALGVKMVYVLGVTNVIGLLLVLLSCRCIPMIGSLTAGLTKSKFYQSFYKYHCYYWMFFIISVILHAIVALLSFGFPF
jgi:hypothetical protein